MYNTYKTNKQNKPQNQKQQQFNSCDYSSKTIDTKDQGNKFKRNNHYNHKWNDERNDNQFKEDRDIKNNKFSDMYDNYEKPLKYKQKNYFRRSSPNRYSYSSSSDSYRSHKYSYSDSEDDYSFQDKRNSSNQNRNISSSLRYSNHNKQQQNQSSYIKNKNQKDHSKKRFRQVGLPKTIKQNKQAHHRYNDKETIKNNNKIIQPEHDRQDKRREESSTNSSHTIKRQQVELVIFGSKYQVQTNTIKNFNKSLLKIFKIIQKRDNNENQSKDESNKLQIAIRLIILDKICSQFETDQDFKQQNQRLEFQYKQLLKEAVNQYRYHCHSN